MMNKNSIFFIYYILSERARETSFLIMDNRIYYHMKDVIFYNKIKGIHDENYVNDVIEANKTKVKHDKRLCMNFRGREYHSQTKEYKRIYYKYYKEMSKRKNTGSFINEKIKGKEFIYIDEKKIWNSNEFRFDSHNETYDLGGSNHICNICNSPCDFTYSKPCKDCETSWTMGKCNGFCNQLIKVQCSKCGYVYYS